MRYFRLKILPRCTQWIFFSDNPLTVARPHRILTGFPYKAVHCMRFSAFQSRSGQQGSPLFDTLAVRQFDSAVAERSRSTLRCSTVAERSRSTGTMIPHSGIACPEHRQKSSRRVPSGAEKPPALLQESTLLE